LYHLAEGPEVLTQRHDFALPGPAVLVVLAFAPPALCGICYWLWCIWNPDGPCLARRRRSRAGVQALASLHAIARDDQAGAQGIAAVVTTYLQHRLDLPVIEPTPAEVQAHLEHAGCASILSGQAADLFRLCDAACFSGEDSRGQRGLLQAAQRLILALEAEPCHSPVP
jgi:hypothetical protein